MSSRSIDFRQARPHDTERLFDLLIGMHAEAAVAPLAPERLTEKVSLPSHTLSPITNTEMDLGAEPGGNERVPLAA